MDNSSADFNTDPLKIGVWVQALSFTPHTHTHTIQDPGKGEWSVQSRGHYDGH